MTFEASGSDFWSPIYDLVTRNIQVNRDSSERKPLLPEEAIDRVTALKMTTTWGAEYVMGEDTIGTLEPGKYADFVVLGKDYFTMPVEEILESVPVVMTVLNGQTVYDRYRLAN